MSDLRTFVLWARELLTREASELIEQVYRLDSKSGVRLPIPKGYFLETSAEAQAIRATIEKLLDDEVDAGLKREDAIAKLIRETAFTHLNRFVAFKLIEVRGLVERSLLAKHHASNGFKMWSISDRETEELYNRGDNPNERDGFEEAPRDRAYRLFLLAQCNRLATEIKVLFDSSNLPSRLFPRPGALKQLIDALNAADREPDWAAGNEETVGWVYQYFNAEEKAAAFDRVFKKKKKFEKADLPAATQVFTPRWIVRYLVENSLGRLWLAMHPDSKLGERLKYLVPLPASPPAVALKPVKEIRILDPATGTMHFGLVAFDLLTEMYREELAHAGTVGWPEEASIQNELDIPGAILANNLFGIDIDLRAVQLAALALYLKAKAANKQSVLTESNLACADVAIFRGPHLNKITSEMALPSGFTRELFIKFRDSLEEASMMGSLVRLDQHFQNIQSDRLRQSIDAYVEKKRDEGVDESYFANETSKGLRLLNVVERRYDIVFTNPPYMSNRNMNPTLSAFMKRNYQKSKGDLYSAFIERCAELLGPEGRLAMIAQQSFMFISSCEDLRELLLGATAIESMAHVGPRAFAEVTGEKVNTTAFVLRREQLEMERMDARGVYFRLIKEPDAESKRIAFERALASYGAGRQGTHVYDYRQRDFAAISGAPWVYWVTSGLRALFANNRNLAQIAPATHGTATYDNFRFLRYWWEVQPSSLNRDIRSWQEYELKPADYVPYMKGGSFQRWYGNQAHVLQMIGSGRALTAFLDSKRDSLRGLENVFRPGVTYSFLTANKFSARLSPGGFIFDVAGSSMFPEDISLVLALLNSTFAQFALKLVNPTVNFQVGDLARLPVPNQIVGPLRELVDNAIVLARIGAEEDETTPDFRAPPRWPDGVELWPARHRQLDVLEEEIDAEVYRLYQISSEDRQVIEDELATATAPDVDAEQGETENEEPIVDSDEGSLTIGKLALKWVGYAVGIALGRFARSGLEPANEADGVMLVHRDHPDDLAQRVIDLLTTIHTEAEAIRIVRAAIGDDGDLRDALASYLLGPFFKAHTKQYRKRPIYWLLQSPKQNFSVYLFHERATEQTLALLQSKRYLGGRTFQLAQQLKQAKERELTTEGREKAQWKRKAQEVAEELIDLEAFHQAIEDSNNEPVIGADGQATTARWVPEFDDGILLNAAPLYRLTPAWKKADPKLDLSKVWKALKEGEYPWAKTAMRYWPRETLAACKDNKSYRIAHGLE